MKTYDLIYQLLEKYPELRDSDRRLMWKVWEVTGSVRDGIITQSSFLDAEHFETVRRTRQKIQELHPELASSPQIQAYKDEKEAQKGTFVYREKAHVDLSQYMAEYQAMKNQPEVINEQPTLV